MDQLHGHQVPGPVVGGPQRSACPSLAEGRLEGLQGLWAERLRQLDTCGRKPLPVVDHQGLNLLRDRRPACQRVQLLVGVPDKQAVLQQLGTEGRSPCLDHVPGARDFDVDHGLHRIRHVGALGPVHDLDVEALEGR